jgi:ABC-type Co2+ transport system permease subunit
MQKKGFFTEEYIIGVVLFLSALYLESEGRLIGANLFNLGAITAFIIDIFKKVKYARELGKKVKKDIEESEKK